VTFIHLDVPVLDRRAVEKWLYLSYPQRGAASFDSNADLDLSWFSPMMVHSAG
jgi:hypothetical protein